MSDRKPGGGGGERERGGGNQLSTAVPQVTDRSAHRALGEKKGLGGWVPLGRAPIVRCGPSG